MADGDAAFTINGLAALKGRLSVPQSGPWTLDANMADDAAISGRVTIKLLGATLSGTVAPTQAGTFGQQRRVRVVAGAGGWSKPATKKGYHNDAGISTKILADETAADVGETIGGFAPLVTRLDAVDYTRRDDAPAAVALEAASGVFRWWVDYDGITQVGDRPILTPAAGSYEVLQADLRGRSAVVAVDDLTAVGVGSVLTERLDAPARIGAFELMIEPGSARMLAWLTNDGSASESADLLVSIVERVLARKLLGKYRYRVVKMVADRVELQAVDRKGPMPDQPVVSMWGAPGQHATLNGGDLVMVEFEGGDPALPMITGFAPRGTGGDEPQQLEIAGKHGKAAARQGDTIKVPFPPFLFTGVVGGVPASGVLTTVTGFALGQIEVGSSKVKIDG